MNCLACLKVSLLKRCSFNKITNELNSVGKVFSPEDLVRKILRSLDERWIPKVNAIKEAKDLSRLSVEDLIGSLMTHEMELMPNKDEKQKNKSFMLKAESSTLVMMIMMQVMMKLLY